MKKIIQIILSTALLVLMIACSQQTSPLESIVEDDTRIDHSGFENIDIATGYDLDAPQADTSNAATDVLPYRGALTPQPTPEMLYPQYASVKVEYNADENRYKSAKCRLPNGSIFEIKQGDLTPPAGHPLGEPVIITMKAEFDPKTQELIFSFGPSGCKFDAPAEVVFKWQDLASPNATLYYITEHGNYIDHLPDNIEVVNKKMHLFIDHFSRYSVAYSD